MFRMLGLACVMVAALAPPAFAAAAKRCSQLKGRDLAPAKAVKLVQHRNADDGKDLLGCALPRGKVRLLASSADHYTTVDSFRIRQVSGEKVLLDTSESSQYAEVSSTRVLDIRRDLA